MWPSATAARTASAKRTGASRCRRQNARSGAASRSPPSTAEYSATDGARHAIPAIASASAGPAAAIRGEWKACDTVRRVVRTPCACSAASADPIPSASPESTTSSGAL
ncbi:MAG: hypothetical protein R3F59_13735 [Myxococcota bacterium]